MNGHPRNFPPGRGKIDFAAVKAASLVSIESLVSSWLPGGKKRGEEWVAINPTRSDKKAGSFSINLRTGVWSDFATGEVGADMIDLLAYLEGLSLFQAAKVVGDILGVPKTVSAVSRALTAVHANERSSVLAPAETSRDAESFPLRTSPDSEGKPRFVVAGEMGPPRRSDELRRHAYKIGTTAVRFKVMRSGDAGALNWYRVVDVDGTSGWQLRKPKGFKDVPFIGCCDPFDADLDQDASLIFWPEGEKDVETVSGKGALAFTFGGTGDGLPAGCEEYIRGRHVVILADNDAVGREHANKKAEFAAPLAASVKIVHFTEVKHKGDVTDFFEGGGTLEALEQIAALQVPYQPQQGQPKGSSTGPVQIFWHGIDYNRDGRSWLIKGLIPQLGQGLASGQWGAAKTFAAIDLSASVMTGTPFASRQVCRRGGVLFIAAEGANEIPIRLQGVVEQKLRPAALAAEASGEPLTVDLSRLPFAWIEDCPSLKDEASFERLVATVIWAAAHMKEQFGVDLVLIIVDTLAASANFDDANDAAEGQRIMGRLNTLSRRTGAFVLAVDHFGKVVETGTRGTSAKEAAADVVIALLADRDVAGKISNTRLAVRKLRGGATGAETPFDLKVVNIGTAGETTCIIEWKSELSLKQASTATRWPKSLKIFRSAMHTAVAEHGKLGRPFNSDGPTVRMVRDDVVRAEFMAAYPADGENDMKKTDAKRNAFNRALKTARERDLVCSRDIGGIDHLWQVDDRDKADTHADGPDTP
jgi:AAA domain